MPFSEADPMPALVTFGRVLFAVLFMYTGATKLFAIQQTADFIASKVTIPALLAPYTSQLESMAGMPMPQLLTLGVGGGVAFHREHGGSRGVDLGAYRALGVAWTAFANPARSRR
jgi:hypothetical protein